MISRAISACLLVGLGLLVAACSPPPTPASGLADLGVYLVVEAQGELYHKRPGWKEYLPLSFGTALDRRDLIEVRSDAKGAIVCADLTLAQLPSDYRGSLPCGQTQGPVLTRKGSEVRDPRRQGSPPSSIPYVLSPRNTFIRTGHPVLQWHPSEKGTITYTVRVSGPGVDWQQETTTTRLRYPQEAPSLQDGKSYCLRVKDARGRSSDQEETSLDRSFVLLPPEQAQAIESLMRRVQSLGLDQRGTYLVQAEILACHRLLAEAIALLADLTQADSSPSVHERLGDIYLQIGLLVEAQEAYNRALDGYRSLGHKYGEANALFGLGSSLGADPETEDHAIGALNEAISVYRAIGDTWGVDRSKEILERMRPTPTP